MTHKICKLMAIMILVIMSGVMVSSCGKDDDDLKKDDVLVEESIVGKWICYKDAYGESWGGPLVCYFDADGTGYEWFTDWSFSNRFEFSYTVTSSRLNMVIDEHGEIEVYNLRYEITNNGNTLIIYGWNDEDMDILQFIRE